MITGWTIYWITRLDSIDAMWAVGIGICFALGSFMFLLSESIIRKVWIPISIALVFVLLLVATPSTKEAIAIYVIPKITNNEDVSQIPSNFAKLINEKLQDWMKDVDILPKEKE